MNPIDLAAANDKAEQLTPDNGQPEPDYPTLNIDGVSDPALMNFPESGSAIIHHTVIHRSVTKGRNGKKRHSLRLKIHSIAPHKHKPLSTLSSTKEDEEAIEQGLPALHRGKPLPPSAADENAIIRGLP